MCGCSKKAALALATRRSAFAMLQPRRTPKRKRIPMLITLQWPTPNPVWHFLEIYDLPAVEEPEVPTEHLHEEMLHGARHETERWVLGWPLALRSWRALQPWPPCKQGIPQTKR